ncbi:MAG TPA: hypothetical protein VFF69_14870 [Phycisphaerales bacterium]|nr:hypothetical protein [Phycisphaerales bacterium]
MAEDNRLSQITEGAGLQESRLNVEFIEFIRKWSTPVLLVLAALAVGYFLWNKQKEARDARIDEAFAQLNQSTETTSPSPDALRRIAEDYKGVTGVRLLAQLAAADEYLRAVKRGVKPGAVLNQEGIAENAEDLLTDADRERFLSEAETLYREVHAAAEKQPALALHTLSALYGIGAVAESRGRLDEAKNVLDQAHNLAIKHGFVEHAVRTQERIDALPSRATAVALYHKAELPEIPALKPPDLEPATPIDPAGAVVGPQLPGGAEDGAPPPAEGSEPGGAGEGEDGAAESSGETGDDGSAGPGEASDDDGR